MHLFIGYRDVVLSSLDGARQLLISANGVGIGTGALDASDKLVVNGPIRISDGGTRPLCTQSHRGMIWHEFGELGQVTLTSPVSEKEEPLARDGSFQN